LLENIPTEKKQKKLAKAEKASASETTAMLLQGNYAMQHVSLCHMTLSGICFKSRPL